MTFKLQSVAFYTILKREIMRMFRIKSQVFLPPIITTTLYFLIFGSLIGARIGTILGVKYIVFIAPGLIMMSVITNSYSNVSASLFSTRFQKSIEEMLVSPMSIMVIIAGYVLGGVIRGIIVAILVFLVSFLFLPHNIDFHHLPLTLLVVVLVATLFSLAGLTNAMLAKNFDDIMLIPTFVLTPLTYLGGVFYSVSMLPPFWEKVSQFNPILYMINAMRYAMIGVAEVSFGKSLAIIVALLIAMTVANFIMLKRGIGLRD